MTTTNGSAVLRSLGLVLVVLAAVGGSGCATMIKAKTETVSLQSNPGDADVYIDGAPRGRTPLMLELQPNKEYTVVFKKPGYADQAQVLTSSVAGKWVLLDVAGGLIPVIVDAATGSWKEFDNKLVNVNLPSLRDRDRERERAAQAEEDEAYEDEEREVSAAPRPTARERRARTRAASTGRERPRPAPLAADSER